MQQDVLLVGSIPLDSVEAVFREFGGPLGPSLKTLPDGEVGPRRHWISRIHYQVLSGHPELEAVRRPAPDENGVERQFPRNAGDSWLFKVKDGVERVRFGDPGWRIAMRATPSTPTSCSRHCARRACWPGTFASRCRSPRSTAHSLPASFRTTPISQRSGRASPKHSRRKPP